MKHSLIVSVSVTGLSSTELLGQSLEKDNIRNESFVSGQSFVIEVSVPLSPVGAIDFSQAAHSNFLDFDLFFNGIELSSGKQKSTSSGVRLPGLVYFDHRLSTSDRAAVVKLELSQPTPESEGLYELQLFLDSSDIIRGLPQNCSPQYKNFLESSDGLRLHDVLVGSTTIRLQRRGNYKPHYLIN